MRTEDVIQAKYDDLASRHQLQDDVIYNIVDPFNETQFLRNKCDEYLRKLTDTKKRLDKAKHRLMQIAYLNMTEHGIGSNSMMIDWCKTVAAKGLEEIEEKEQQ